MICRSYGVYIMALYNEVAREIERENYAKTLYRFQGGNSFSCFSNDGDLINETNGGYIYFSTSLDHHKYFTMKRMKQILNRQVLQETSYRIRNYDLRNIDSFNKIRELVINSETLCQLESFKLVYDASFLSLIKDNCCYQKDKPNSSMIERVDRRVYGGGYGITDEWTDLLRYLTFFVSSLKISKTDIVEVLNHIRKNGKTNQKENLSFLLGDATRYNFRLSEGIMNDFTKYDIMNALEMIVQKQLCLPTSDLAKQPTKTIKEVVDNYQKCKRKIISAIDGKLY